MSGNAQTLRCQYCGNNPVPHFLHWYFESLDVAFRPLRLLVAYNPATRLAGRLWKFFRLTAAVTEAGRLLGIVRFADRPSEETSGRARVLWQEAERRGLRMRAVYVFGKSVDCFTLEKAGRTVFFSGLPRPDSRDGGERLDWLDDKWCFRQLCQREGLPVPGGASCRTFSEALAVFRRLRKPCIVKPRAGSRGRHTTTNVSTETELREAFRVAKQLCYWAMVEEHLDGPVYRGTVVGYRCRGVLRGDSPQVTGDGRSSLRELVTAKNRAPHPGTKNIVLDVRAERFLSRVGLGFDSVPEAGRTVFLSEKIGVSYGGSSSEELKTCHPDNVALFERAAKACGDPILGFDFIVPDITEPWHEQRSGFLECNTLPFINLHHDPLKGKPENVAGAILDLVGF